ncbi:16S rRNA (guanine(527)-N(7))-methyltransferase RsmG [Propionivibrio sp.]|uniref:16S rRNA (guanine(527)-N(7))-methyltransferase RsmG n=1 Tax=Propionivibrio sp. TaxID=2212460 RepID=UPI00272EB6C8|nr:16S rRNA (guanine(527)-N(7))-methyltransferase RsmG [Propionivibrio sp.]
MNPAGQLAQGLATMGLDLPAERQEKLLAYVALLYKWNRTYSLTALREQEKAVSHHLLDSLAIVPFVPPGSLLDVGSGGGTPGIPVAIARPDVQVTLLDSNSKKAAFLQQAVIELGLTNVSVHGGRVEQYHPAIGFAAITSRAFAELADFVMLTRHLLAPEGVWLAMKGVMPREEIASLPGDVCLEAVHALQVPGIDGERHLVAMRRSEAQSQ